MDKSTLSHKFNYSEVYSRARKNARLRDIDFQLTREEFNTLVKKADGRCMVSGLTFSADTKREAGKRRPFAPSLDRINSKLGYTKENCRLVSIIVNCALNEWGEKPFIAMCQAVSEKNETRQRLVDLRKGGEADYLRPSEFLEQVGNKIILPMNLGGEAHRYCKKHNLPTRIKQLHNRETGQTYNVTIFMRGVLRECLEILTNR